MPSLYAPGRGLLVLVLLSSLGCRESTDSAAPLEDQRARERAAAYFAQDDRVGALEALRPLLERNEPAAEDLVRGAIVYRSQGDLEQAYAALERALADQPDSAAVHYGLGQLLLFEFEIERAITHLSRAAELAPADVPTMLGLGLALEETSREEALALYKEILDVGFDDAGSFYLTGLFRTQRLLRVMGRAEEAKPYLAEYQRLLDRGLSAPTSEEVARGNLGHLETPRPVRNVARPPGPLPTFAGPRRIALDVAPQSLGPDVRPTFCDFDNDGLLDVLLQGSQGISIALQNEDGTFDSIDTEALRADSPIGAATTLDVDNDDDLDLVLVRAGKLELWSATVAADGEDTQPRIAFARDEAGEPEVSSTVRQILTVDFDHDGDLDLVATTESEPVVLRNDAAGAEGRFEDASAAAGLPQGPFGWVLAGDFDTDQDVDLLFGGTEAIALASNVRGGRFESAPWLAGLPPTGTPAKSRDLDGDGLPDLIWPSDESVEVWLAKPAGGFERVSVIATPARSTAPLAADLDLDGTLDLLVHTQGQWHAIQSLGTSEQLEADLSLAAQPNDSEATSPGAWIGDLDADLAFELALLTTEGLEVYDADAGPGKPLLLSLRGVKDNRRAKGAVLELRSGPIFQRVFWDGGTELLGAGDAEALDWLRITWPNGVVQYDPRLDLGDRRVTNDPLEAFKQIEGLVGSCPFLYAWNGERYEFISDVLGITPLGLPMAPGQIVPPDHDEYVLVRGDQIAPRDGVFELQFTEELREVTYLDRIRLDVVDHPVGTEVFPTERFTFPPFPEPHTHSVEGALAPLTAVDQEGRDWRPQLAAIDDDHAIPFDPAPSQYLGLATPHSIELRFDPDRSKDAQTLRLVMTGWFYWTDASVNVAVARDPEWSFVPPILSVPDGEGGWRDAGPPLGFPAGKSKTMVVDVTGIVDPGDPRLRIFSTLRLYWDSIRLAVDDDDAPLHVTQLEPISAELWRRGFSAPEPDPSGQRPERFHWEVLAQRPRWNPHPGLYTRLGETLPLVTDVDDRYVIMGSGEALTVRFDALDLAPPPEGFVRDYLVYLDGWAKDRDPNTYEALHVEPLPFHGMSTYPYPADESFPDTPEHQAWRIEWNTRSPEPWIVRD